MELAIRALRQQSERLSTDFICSHRLRLLDNILGPLFISRNPSNEFSSDKAIVPPTWHLIFGQQDSQNTLPANKHLSADGYEKWQALDAESTGYKYRVWAGSAYRFNPHRQLRTGDRILERSRIDRVELKHSVQKQGNPTVFITLLKRVGVLTDDIPESRFNDIDDDWVCEERRTLAYRTLPFKVAPAAAKTAAAANSNNSDGSREKIITVIPNNLMLFQYSALTYNSHRIHYDLQYCREQEGFPDLLVHGPLTSTLLLEYFRHHLQPANTKLLSWQYRALSPLFVNQPIHLSGQLMRGNHDALSLTEASFRLTARNQQGQICMQGTATVDF